MVMTFSPAGLFDEEEAPVKRFYSRIRGYSNDDSRAWRELKEAQPIHLGLSDYSDVTFYVHREVNGNEFGQGWSVSEPQTGTTIGAPSPTREEAIKMVEARLASMNRERFDQAIKRNVELNGISPAFKEGGKHESGSREASRNEPRRESDTGLPRGAIVPPDNPRVRTWMKHPGRLDVTGVDTKLTEDQRLKIREALHAKLAAFKTKNTGGGAPPHIAHGPKPLPTPTNRIGKKIKKLKAGGMTRRVRTGRIAK